MPYHLPQDKPVSLRERLYLTEAIRGLRILTGHFLRNFFFTRETNPDILARSRKLSLNATLAYPEEKVPYPPGYRGLHRLVPREDGKPRCVACYMCATACPAQCIYIEAGELEGDPIEKYPTQFVIDELRCVVCGFCVEACPKDAIRMDTGEHAPPTYQRSQQIWDMKRLLRGTPVSYQYDPWLRRGASSIPEDKLAEMRANARPFHTVATDEYAQTPGFSVKALAAEARARVEAKK
ncbi:MAG TPA: NADH-quinone oxidoreductase subunit I [Anaeromyxobacteraceae bacterium]|jgi:NADH-quinone oxidoreductase subunit I|nr:NADH-quinone oxidoreductase subunit I [Anaeromyxobacteraceae bacterium]